MFEVILSLVLVVALYAVSVYFINPTILFKSSLNTRRIEDLKNIKTSIDKYFTENADDGSIHSLINFNGFLALKSIAINGGYGSCPGAVLNGIPETIPNTYDISTKGIGNFIDISSIVNENYLSKLPKDPLDGSFYKACIDSANANQLVMFAPNIDGKNKPIASVNTGFEGTSENLVYNPSFEENDEGYEVSNASISKVASGASVYFPKVGDFYESVTTTDSDQSFISYKLKDWRPGETLTGSVSVDKRKYTGEVKLELQDYDGANWNTSEVIINNPGRYAITRTLRKDTKDFRILVSAKGAVGTYYVDAFQVENKSVVTTYIDGSRGKNYIWNGVANASTSKRLK